MESNSEKKGLLGCSRVAASLAIGDGVSETGGRGKYGQLGPGIKRRERERRRWLPN